MEENVVQISELRNWANKIFDAVERRGISRIDLPARFYWTLDSVEIWDGTPPTATVGDLADDLQDIRNDLETAEDDAERSIIVWHTLDHFIGVLGKLSADLKGSSTQEVPA